MHGVTKRRAFTRTGKTYWHAPPVKGDLMLRLKRIADAMRMSADALEGYYKERSGDPSTETAKLIKELRELTREIQTSQEFLNSKIKL
jgi:type III secretory pathway component EscU